MNEVHMKGQSLSQSRVDHDICNKYLWGSPEEIDRWGSSKEEDDAIDDES